MMCLLHVFQDNSVYVYTLSDDKLSEKKKFSLNNEVSDAAYSPDGKSLAVTNGKMIVIYDSASYVVYKTIVYY